MLGKAYVKIITAAALGILLYREEVTGYKLVGMAAILGSVLLINRQNPAKN